jgi:uncharacterized protein (DUF1015 family)
MSLIRPFCGILPQSPYVAQVIAPPYDVISSAQAKIFAADKPWSFLHLSKPEIDCEAGADSQTIYNHAQHFFARMQQQKVLQKDATPHYYLYRLTTPTHQQTGLVASVSVAAYQQNQVRRHEQTQPNKVADRVQQITAVQAHTGPVLLAYRQQPALQKLYVPILARTPDLTATAADGIKHEVWRIEEKSLIENITAQFEKIATLYIADGHHRAEAAAQVAQQNADPRAQYFLGVIFPDNELEILGYHRVVKDLNGLSAETFLQALAKDFVVQPMPQAFQPKDNIIFGLYVAGRWYQLGIDPQKIAQRTLTEQLSVSILTDFILTPILNIHDLRRDPRIAFVGGKNALAELQQQVDQGQVAAAFSVMPIALRTVMDIADANQFMPPKSTWFEPKLADGLISYTFNE